MKNKLSPIRWLIALPAFILLVSLACIDQGLNPDVDEELASTEYYGRPTQLAASGLKLLEQIDSSVDTIVIQGNYAYLGMITSLIVVDISDPAAPRLVGQSGPLPGMINDLALSDNYAFLANWSYGLRVVDISDPTEPYQISYQLDEGEVKNIVLSGDYAYLAIEDYGIRVMDISDPYHPTRLGIDRMKITPQGLSISGDYLYLADWAYGILVIDTSDPTNPKQVGDLYSPTHVGQLALSGNYAFISDFRAPLRAIDISEPTAPVNYSFSFPGESYKTLELVISGDYAYLGSILGLQIIDISDPARMSIVSTYDLPFAPLAIAIAGDYAFISGDFGGLCVLDISDPAHPALVGGD